MTPEYVSMMPEFYRIKDFLPANYWPILSPFDEAWETAPW